MLRLSCMVPSRRPVELTSRQLQLAWQSLSPSSLAHPSASHQSHHLPRIASRP
ncbi:hypothetical protein JMJ78_0009527, partial [Colletotrichum scovillei]